MAHILLAEDDKSMLNFLVIALERAGHTVTTRTDGMEAWKALETDSSYDLLLTDIVMPGIDGLELAQKATVKYPNLKIMFITGFAAMAMDHHEEEEKQTPNILSKPFHLNDLVERVQDVLQE